MRDKRSMDAERGSLPLLAIHGTAVLVHPWTLRQEGVIAEKRLLRCSSHHSIDLSIAEERLLHCGSLL